MEMSLREWLIVLGFIIIAAVVIDGLRRVRRARRDSREIAESMAGSAYQSPVEESHNPELPNQGFRVIRRGEDSRDFVSQFSEASSAVPESGLDSKPPQIEDEQRYSEDLYRNGKNNDSENNDSDIGQDSGGIRRDVDYRHASHDRQRLDPQSLQATDYGPNAGSDPGGEFEQEITSGASYADEKFTAFDGESDIRAEDMPFSADARSQSVNENSPVSENASGGSLSKAESLSKENIDSAALPGGDDFKDRFLKKITSTHASGSKAFKSALNSRKSSPKKQNQAENQQGKHPEQDFDEVIVVNVLARGDEEFGGKQLKNLIEACGMQLGDMSIYHRHEYDFDKGPVQFSMANVMPPGTFATDLEKTPGVSFFVKLPGPDESMLAFDYMIETAQCIVRNLGGELRDENHSVMTAQTIEHCRQRVREFERRQLSQRV